MLRFYIYAGPMGLEDSRVTDHRQERSGYGALKRPGLLSGVPPGHRGAKLVLSVVEPPFGDQEQEDGVNRASEIQE